MDMQFIKVLGLSLGLSIFSHSSYAALENNTALKNAANTSVPNSLVEKALNQQKRNVSALGEDNDLIMLNSIRVTPSQNFFAAQHQRFSRFVQSLFQPHSS